MRKYGTVTLAILALILSLSALMPSCGETSQIPPVAEAPPPPPKHKIEFIQNTGTWTDPYIYILKVDGCEYIIARWSDNGITMVHKANCPNPIHKQAEVKN